MANENKVCILFWRVKDKTNPHTGEAPIYCRVTVNKRRIGKGFTTGITATEHAWHSKKKRLQGKSELVRTGNNALDLLESKFKDILYEFDKTDTPCTIEQVMAKYKGEATSEPERTLGDLVNSWWSYFAQRVEIGENAPRTLETYEGYNRTILAYFGEGKKLNSFKSIDFENLRLHIRKQIILKGHNTGKPKGTNSAGKALGQFKALFIHAYKCEWINRDPYQHHTAPRAKAEKVYINTLQLQKLQNFVTADEKLQQAKQVFLFCSYTGFSYADYCVLHQDQHMHEHEGKPYIIKAYREKSPRAKRYGKSIVPILPEAQAILDLYGKLENLPHPESHELNLNLKIIWALIGVERKVCIKNARHTFINYARTTLGMHESTIATIVGHSQTRTTEESYLNRDINTIAEDLKRLKQPAKVYKM